MLVCILVGTASSKEKAADISAFFEKCIFCVVSICKDNSIFTVLNVPSDHRWWVESIKQQPKGTVGLERAEIFYPETIKVTNPWSSGDVKPEKEKPPCNAECLTCRAYGHRCPGCPATTHYMKRN